MTDGWGRGWLVIEELSCDECGDTFALVIAVGEQGLVCPKCGVHDPDFYAPGDSDEPANDGAWLTGDVGGFPDVPPGMNLGEPL